MHETSTRSPTLTCLDAGTDRLDRADGLVAEDPTVGHRRDVAFEDVQVGAADRDGVDADDRVGVVRRWSASASSHAFWPGPWYTSARMSIPLLA